MTYDVLLDVLFRVNYRVRVSHKEKDGSNVVGRKTSDLITHKVVVLTMLSQIISEICKFWGVCASKVCADEVVDLVAS